MRLQGFLWQVLRIPNIQLWNRGQPGKDTSDPTAATPAHHIRDVVSHWQGVGPQSIHLSVDRKVPTTLQNSPHQLCMG